jgi:hypothetical protein
LCESVDVFAGSSNVKPGGTANFAIWLSSAGADSTGVTVTLTTTPTAAAPHFAVCPSGHTATCTLTTLANSQVFELQAAVVTPTSSTNGEHVQLTAKMTVTKPQASVKASATVTVTVPASPTPGTSGPTPLPVTTTGGLPGTTLPLVPGSVTSATGGNVGPLLPSIPAVTPSPSALPAAGTGAAAPAADVGPLDRRLMGTQLIALAALCAGIGIVIARFTLRTPRPAVAAGTPAGGAAAAGAAGAGAADAGAAAGGAAGLADGSGKDGSAPDAHGDSSVASVAQDGPLGGNGSPDGAGSGAKDGPLGKESAETIQRPEANAGPADTGTGSPADPPSQPDAPSPDTPGDSPTA